MSEQQEQSLPPGETSQASTLRPMYFSVSPLKLVVMAVCTLGLYEIYWFYRNWCYVKDREPDIMPFARAFFAPLFCYSLFNRIQLTAESQSRLRRIVPGPLAAAWFILTVLSRLPDPFWLVSFLSVICLVPVQTTINEINIATNPQFDLNRRFSGWNIAAVVIGGLFLILGVIGMFVPAN